MRRTVDRAKRQAGVRPYLSAAVGSLSSLTSAAGARVGVACREPAAPEVVANYASGWVLFGVPDNRLATLEWRTFPRRAIITPETARVQEATGAPASPRARDPL